MPPSATSRTGFDFGANTGNCFPTEPNRTGSVRIIGLVARSSCGTTMRPSLTDGTVIGQQLTAVERVVILIGWVTTIATGARMSWS